MSQEAPRTGLTDNWGLTRGRGKGNKRSKRREFCAEMEERAWAYPKTTTSLCCKCQGRDTASEGRDLGSSQPAVLVRFIFIKKQKENETVFCGIEQRSEDSRSDNINLRPQCHLDQQQSPGIHEPNIHPISMTAHSSNTCCTARMCTTHQIKDAKSTL